MNIVRERGGRCVDLLLGGLLCCAGEVPYTWAQSPETVPRYSETAIESPPLVVRFKTSRQLMPLPLEATSPSGDYVLRIPSLTSLSTTARFQKQIQEALVGREICVEFTNRPDILLRIKLVRVSPQSLAIDLRYALDRGLFEGFALSYPRLERARVSLSNSLADARRNIPEFERQVASLTKSRRLLEKQPVSDRYAATRKELTLAEMQSRLQRLKRRLDEERQQRQESQRKLELIPGIVKFLEGLDEKPIPYCVLLRGKEGERVLMATADRGGNRRQLLSRAGDN